MRAYMLFYKCLFSRAEKFSYFKSREENYKKSLINKTCRNPSGVLIEGRFCGIVLMTFKNGGSGNGGGKTTKSQSQSR